MKKFFSFAIAAMLALPMFAQDKVVEFTATDFEGKGTTNTGSEITVTKDEVTFTVDKGFGNQYAVRCYKGSVVTISATENIKGLEFVFDVQSGTTYNDGGNLTTSIAVGATSWTHTNETAQTRFKNIKVILGEGTYEPTEPEDPVDPEQPTIPTDYEEITLADAITLCEGMADKTYSEKTYRVVGVVSTAYEYSEQYGNQNFYFGADEDAGKGSTLEAYRAKVSAPGVTKGDKVAVYGKLGVRTTSSGNRSIGFEQGSIVEVLNETAIEDTMVDTKAVKVIRDGKVVIVRGNMEYNVLGTTVK